MKNKLSRAITMDKVMQIVDEEVELTKRRISTRLKRFFKDGNQSSARRNMKLKFINKIPEVILTGDEIKGEGDTPIKVALVDDPSEHAVDVGPEASASVEIVLLKGEPDASQGGDEEFIQNIVPEIHGKKPLLDGNVAIKLQKGIGVVDNIKLRHHTIKIRPSVFKLGARVVDAFDGVCVKEAKTESFTVQDFRKKYYKKHDTPSLSDDVFRLCNIGKGGNIYKRLKNNDIKTVEDFLIRLLINPDELESIFKMGRKKWEATINNARACSTNTRMYCYVNLEHKKGVVFNVLGQVLGLYLESHYHPMSMLPEKHKAHAQELLASAYKNWVDDVKPFDDFNTLQQHLTCLSTYMDPPDCPGGGHENMEASELIGESSSRRSNASFHSVSSAMNSVRGIGGEDFSSFGNGDQDVGIICDAATSFPLDLDTMFPGFDEFLQQNNGCNVLNGLINEANADASNVAFMEAEVVQTSNSPKRWKKLLCVSRWFLIRKRVSVDVSRDRKKQKIG